MLGNDTNVDGDALSVSSVTQGASGTVVINADQTVTDTGDVFGGVGTQIQGPTVRASSSKATDTQAQSDFRWRRAFRRM